MNPDLLETLEPMILGIAAEYDHVPPATLARFFKKVKLDESGCWLWTAAHCRGYGQFFPGAGVITTGRAVVYAHRWIYEQAHGPIPEGLTIDHLCRTPACVNPAHMEPVSNEENALRGNGWHEGKCGNGHPLTEDNIYEYPTRRMRRCKECRRLWQKARRAEARKK